MKSLGNYDRLEKSAARAKEISTLHGHPFIWIYWMFYCSLSFSDPPHVQAEVSCYERMGRILALSSSIILSQIVSCVSPPQSMVTSAYFR